MAVGWGDVEKFKGNILFKKKPKNMYMAKY